MKVIIKNWEKYNHKTAKKTTWLRLEHDILNDPKIMALSQGETLGFIYILCMASRAQKNIVVLDEYHMAIHIKVLKTAIKSIIRKLLESELICEFHENNSTNPIENNFNSLRTNERTDERTNLLELDDLEKFSIHPSLEPVGTILKGKKITRTLQNTWLEFYSKEFLIQKIKDLWLWEQTAGLKGRKKNWGRFYNNCFSKDWDKYSKRLPGKQAIKAVNTVDSVDQDLDQKWVGGEKNGHPFRIPKNG